MFYTLSVGKLFKEGVHGYPEGIRFDVSQTGCNLFIYFYNPTQEEIQSISNGSLKIGYYVEDEVIIMLFKFQNLNWMDAPYSVHLSLNFDYLEELSVGQGYALNIYLIDARTGILKTMRLVSMQNNFSNKFRNAIEKQQTLLFDAYKYDKKIHDIYLKYTTKQLVDRMTEYCTLCKHN